MEASDLRKAILQYAMEGKLVKQNPNDEPASVLLERIKDEKNRLIKEGKIKKDSKESFIYKGDDNHYYEKIGNNITDITDEVPFDIPNNWEFIRQGFVCWLKNGKAMKGEILPYLEAKTIRGTQDAKFIDNGTYVEKGQKIILVDGENSGEVMEVPYDGYMGSTFRILEKSEYINYDYLSYFFLLNKNKYKDNKKGAAIPHLNKTLFANMFFPLPPLSEQERIVNKLDNLMPLVDEYERLLAENEKLDNEFPDKLKQSILQYAMEGKLVKQDPSNEPASVLLEKIKQEKEKLIKEGKIKRDKNESIIYKGDDKNYYEKIGNKIVNVEDEILVDTNSEWGLAYLKDIALLQTGASFDKSEANASGANIRVLRGGNIQSGKVIFKNDDIYIKKNLISDKILINAGDIITPSVSSLENIGKDGLVELDYDNVVVGGFVYIIRPYLVSPVLSKYIYYWLQAPATQVLLRGITKKSGSAFYNLSKEKFSRVIVPLPSFTEMERIICKIEVLISSINIF